MVVVTAYFALLTGRTVLTRLAAASMCYPSILVVSRSLRNQRHGFNSQGTHIELMNTPLELSDLIRIGWMNVGMCQIPTMSPSDIFSRSLLHIDEQPFSTDRQQIGHLMMYSRMLLGTCSSFNSTSLKETIGYALAHCFPRSAYRDQIWTASSPLTQTALAGNSPQTKLQLHS